MTPLIRWTSYYLGLAAVFMLGFAVACLLRPQPVRAGFDVGDLLEGAVKVGGVKLAIDEYGDEINDAINKLLDNNDASVDATTKVVPIISVLGNKHIGAAQVVGPEEAVNKVEAVAQLEQSFMNKLFRLRALVPIEGDDVDNLHRVKGVAVSAMIDVKL
ncbi:hypothetical protein JW859_05965 [bacterium]|nr:hypothetical protein [bacterium]